MENLILHMYKDFGNNLWNTQNSFLIRMNIMKKIMRQIKKMKEYQENYRKY